MKVISIVGAKAGVGATTTTVNLALRLQKMGERVCVVDMAPDGSADVGFLLGVPGQLRSSTQVLSHQAQLGAEKLFGYLTLPRVSLAALQLQAVEDWHALRAMLNPFSMLLVDGLVVDADHVLLVTSPDPLALRATQSATERLQASLISSQRTSLVLNGCETTDSAAHEALQSRYNDCPIYHVSVAATQMRQAALSGKPVALHHDALNLCQEWDRIASAICALSECHVDTAANPDHLIRRLLTQFQDQQSGITDRDEAAAHLRRMLAEIPEGERMGIDADSLIIDVVNAALGLGMLEPLMQDASITEIMINGSRQMFVERNGQLSLHPQPIPEESLSRIIERILAPLGRRVDESSPMVDTRLPDGSRVNIVIPPLALNGPTVTIRRFSPTMWRLNDLVVRGSLTMEMTELLRHAILNRKNIVVSGGTGSGKTTLLNVLSAEIPSDERIITIEDAAELRLTQPHVVRLESRPANLEGKGAVSIRDLVKNALRMRPNRIIVGECRGAEALDMLQAMNTGHDGSLTTLHANSPRAALSRLETMVMFAGMDLPARAIREQIANAVQLIVQIARRPNGRRCVVEIAEITAIDGDGIQLKTIAEAI